jgi:hypothetical protein
MQAKETLVLAVKANEVSLFPVGRHSSNEVEAI